MGRKQLRFIAAQTLPHIVRGLKEIKPKAWDKDIFPKLEKISDVLETSAQNKDKPFVFDMEQLIKADKELEALFAHKQTTPQNPPLEKEWQSHSAPPFAESKITPQQMKALSKKHLLLMILDLQTQLERARKETENILLAYKAGSSFLLEKRKEAKENHMCF